MEDNIEFLKNINNHYASAMSAGAPRTYVKTLDNSPNSPWLDLICSGKKTYEGRLYVGMWPELNVGDIIVFKNDRSKKKVETVVKKIKHFSSFGEAYKKLGQKFIPITNMTVDEANKISYGYYNKKDIEKYGMVAIKIQVINKNNANCTY